MPTLLITGANRGLGLGLTDLYLADGWRVHACVRDTSRAKALSDLSVTTHGQLTIHAVDVEDHDTIDALAAVLRGQSIDLLLNVAGFYGSKIISDPGGLQRFGESNFSEWEKMFRINVIAPMKMAESFVENIAKSAQKKIVTLTSVIGFEGARESSNVFGYRATKTASNAVMKAMAIALKPRGIIALPLHPGWVRTEMGGPNADIDVETSVVGMKKVIDGLKPDDAGTLMTYDGRRIA